jgi:hypothetical protein
MRKVFTVSLKRMLLLPGFLLLMGGATGISNADYSTMQISGAGIKGPLAFADVQIFALNPSFPDYYDNSSPISTTTTNQYAEINGLSSLKKSRWPYILVIDGSNAIDLNTGVAPVIDKLITVVTDDMLANGRPVFATPLTTLAFHATRLGTEASNYNRRYHKKKAFTKDINEVANMVSNIFAISQDINIDILRAPLVINKFTIELAEQELAVHHRASVEAFAAKVYEQQQKRNISTDAVIQKLAQDLHRDGIIDNSDNGRVIGNIDPVIFTQDPMGLLIPNTDYRIKDIMMLMSEERVQIGTNQGPTFLIDEIAYPETKSSTDTRPSADDSPEVTLSINKIDFGKLTVGDISDPLTLTLTNSGTAPLNISGITVSSGFLEANNCNNSVPVGENCIFDIQFSPTILGPVNGALTITGDDVVGVHVIELLGTGINDVRQEETEPLSTDIKLYIDHDSHSIGPYTEQDVYSDFNAIRCCGGVISESIAIVPDPTGDPSRGNVMRVFQAKGSHTFEGGSDGQWQAGVGGEHEELYFAFDYYREPDAIWSKGQKMPGLAGGDWAKVSGGTNPNGKAFSSRIMFFSSLAYPGKGDGAISQFAYYLDQSQKTKWYDDGPEGQYRIVPGKWQTIETRVKMNTVGRSDGVLQAWVDGQLVLDLQNFVWRDGRNPDLKISGIYMTFGYGGGNDTWDSPEDQFNYYDNWTVSTKPISHYVTLP